MLLLSADLVSQSAGLKFQSAGLNFLSAELNFLSAELMEGKEGLRAAALQRLRKRELCHLKVSESTETFFKVRFLAQAKTKQVWL